MKLINRDTDYAIKALMHIARNSQRVSVSELTEKLDMPRPFLRKIFQIMNKEGILQSYKGKGGGFVLNVPPQKILLTDLIRIFQGPIKLNECIFKKKICPDVKRCPLKKRIEELEKQVISELQSITLSDLFEENSVSS